MPRPNGRDPRSDPAAFLGAQLRRARLAAGCSSQDSFAAVVGFDRSTVTGLPHPPAPSTWRLRHGTVRHRTLERRQ
jgi:hypothetical protein